jgi:hypothetical protein
MTHRTASGALLRTTHPITEPYATHWSYAEYQRQRARLIRQIDTARQQLATLDALMLNLPPMDWPKSQPLIRSAHIPLTNTAKTSS